MRLGIWKDARAEPGTHTMTSSKKYRERFPVVQKERNKDKRSSYGGSEAVRL